MSKKYVRKESLVTIWGQVVDALQQCTFPLASGLGTALSIAQSNSQSLTLHDARLVDLESYFEGSSVKEALHAASATKATGDEDGNSIKNTYLKLTGGVLCAANSPTPLTIKGGESANAGIVFRSNADDFIGQIGVRSVSSVSNPYFYDGAAFRTIWHANNSNKYDVDWTCKGLTAHDTIKPYSNNSQDLGGQNNVFNYTYTNFLVTPSAYGMRFGTSNGDNRFSWFSSRTSFVDGNRLMVLDKNSRLTLYNGSDPYYRVNPTSGEHFAFGASSSGGYIWGYTISGSYLRFKNGKIGVRNDNPSCALDVVGDVQATGGMAAGGIVDLSLQTPTSAYLLLRNTGLGLTSNPNGISYNHTLDPGASGMFPNNNWASALLTIRRHSDEGYTSQLGFSNTEMFFRYSLSGSWYTIQHSGNTGNASDKRLKENIKSLTLESAKDIIMKASPVTFRWNKKAESLRSDLKGEDLGLIAQDVKELIPSAVGTIFDKYEKLDYTKFIAPLIRVVQEQQKEIENLKKLLGK